MYESEFENEPIPKQHEKEFGDFFLERSALRVRLGMLAAVLIFSMASFADTEQVPEDVLAWSVPARVFIVCPMLMLLAWVASSPARFAWHRITAVLVFAVSGGVVAGIVVHLQLIDQQWDMQRLSLLTLGIYILSGLRARAALGLGLSTLAVIACVELSLPDADGRISRGLVSLVASNIMGASAAFAMEASLRTSFLAQMHLRKVAERDGLTGLFNRRHLDAYLTRVYRQCLRDKQGLAVAMLDVDEFKHFNDRFGHLAGDECLRSVARCLGDGAQRPMDLVARYGGEEFCLVWYGAAPEAVEQLAAECLRAVEALAIEHPGASASEYVTVSCGVAVNVAEHEGPEHLLATADAALYEAKRQGRNRAIVASQPIDLAGRVGEQIEAGRAA